MGREGGGGGWRVSSKGTYNWTGKKASKRLLSLAVLIQICFVFTVFFKASKCHFNKSILISKRWVLIRGWGAFLDRQEKAFQAILPTYRSADQNMFCIDCFFN